MNSKWLHAHCTKQPSPYLKRIEAHLFERKLSLTDTSFQVLMNFFIEVSCFPFEYYDNQFDDFYTKKDKKIEFLFLSWPIC